MVDTVAETETKMEVPEAGIGDIAVEVGVIVGVYGYIITPYIPKMDSGSSVAISTTTE